MEEFAGLLHVGPRLWRIQGNRRADRFGLLEDGFGLLGIVFRPGFAGRVPGADFSEVAVGEVAAFVKHCVVNGIVVDGVRCCLAQIFAVRTAVGKNAFFQIKGDKGGPEGWDVPGLELIGVFGGKFRGIGVRHIVD